MSEHFTSETEAPRSTKNSGSAWRNKVTSLAVAGILATGIGASHQNKTPNPNLPAKPAITSLTVPEAEFFRDEVGFKTHRFASSKEGGPELHVPVIDLNLKYLLQETGVDKDPRAANIVAVSIWKNGPNNEIWEYGRMEIKNLPYNQDYKLADQIAKNEGDFQINVVKTTLKDEDFFNGVDNHGRRFSTEYPALTPQNTMLVSPDIDQDIENNEPIQLTTYARLRTDNANVKQFVESSPHPNTVDTHMRLVYEKSFDLKGNPVDFEVVDKIQQDLEDWNLSPMAIDATG